MFKFYSLFFLLLISIGTETQGYKILCFCPQFGGSHIAFISHIADILVDAGHDVVMHVFQ